MTQDELRFELDRLTAYDGNAIIAEVRRVADLVSGPLTRSAFDAYARADSATVIRKLGGWRKALEAAGLGHRYGGPTVSRQMRERAAQRFTDEQLLDEIRRAAQETARQAGQARGPS